jgi:hypothetical protein
MHLLQSNRSSFGIIWKSVNNIEIARIAQDKPERKTRHETLSKEF